MNAKASLLWRVQNQTHVAASSLPLARPRVTRLVGLVVLSPAFIGKGWTNYELDGIVTKSVTGEQVLLPIWHKLSKQEVIAFSPSLADRLARNTALHTTDEIAAEIAELIEGNGS